MTYGIGESDAILLRICITGRTAGDNSAGTGEPESSLHPSSQMDRPHIIYNKETKNM